ncbi:polar amino acid transport system substrate-binding protein [Myxococcus virescens]|uniref:Polar amino acid transport system substrate-binding protein n=1 Tax=Myxococcus virescens TaxID=83456 RepID=A0ABY0MQE5_9BACT|nr:polar amino acid transport system substrate-binding protein [Myxococcus virescens]
MRGERRVGVLLFGWLALLLGACGLPRDTHGTQERIVRDGVLRAGLVRHEPWTGLQDGKPMGPEAEAVAKLAEQLGARVSWTVAPEAELVHALEERAVDVVVGGITAKSPWVKQLGAGQPYLTTRMRVGAPPGQTVPESLEGASVSVAPGSDAGPQLQSLGARVREVERLHEAPGLRAAWDWQLDGWGYAAGEDVLREEQRIWVVPAGENRWLFTVDRFVLDHAEPIRQRLLASARAGETPTTSEEDRR